MTQRENIGRYQILEDIASGSQGAVYQAYDTESSQIVALKVLHPHLQDSEYLERFSREASLTISIDHPNIITVFEVGHDGKQHFMSMEYLPQSLSRILSTGSQMDISQVVKFGAQICDGLSAAHDLGIVHRDLKPQNVLIGTNGEAKVTDFGIARAAQMNTMTATGALMGTPLYMSPEASEGENVDFRSDIYSVGCMLYEMVSGRVPFTGNTPIAVMRKHIDEKPRPLRRLRKNAPKSLIKVVERAMEKNPRKRFQSVSDLSSALKSSVPEAMPPDQSRQSESPQDILTETYMDRYAVAWQKANKKRWAWVGSTFSILMAIVVILFKLGLGDRIQERYDMSPPYTQLVTESEYVADVVERTHEQLVPWENPTVKPVVEVTQEEVSEMPFIKPIIEAAKDGLVEIEQTQSVEDLVRSTRNQLVPWENPSVRNLLDDADIPTGLPSVVQLLLPVESGTDDGEGRMELLPSPTPMVLVVSSREATATPIPSATATLIPTSTAVTIALSAFSDVATTTALSSSTLPSESTGPAIIIPDRMIMVNEDIVMSYRGLPNKNNEWIWLFTLTGKYAEFKKYKKLGNADFGEYSVKMPSVSGEFEFRLYDGTNKLLLKSDKFFVNPPPTQTPLPTATPTVTPTPVNPNDLGGGVIVSGQKLWGMIDVHQDTDDWTFYGNKGQIVTIVMNSNSEVDPFIWLYSPSGVEENWNDDYGGSNTAQIAGWTLRETGIYTIRTQSSKATFTDPTKIGDYALSVDLSIWGEMHTPTPEPVYMPTAVPTPTRLPTTTPRPTSVPTRVPTSVSGMDYTVAPTSTPPSTSTTATGGLPTTVSVTNNQFTPSSLIISVGTTVRWEFLEGLHSVAAVNVLAFNSGLKQSGSNFSYQFNSPGSYSYICTIHGTGSNMRGTISVVATSSSSTNMTTSSTTVSTPTRTPTPTPSRTPTPTPSPTVVPSIEYDSQFAGLDGNDLWGIGKSSNIYRNNGLQNNAVKNLGGGVHLLGIDQYSGIRYGTAIIKEGESFNIGLGNQQYSMSWADSNGSGYGYFYGYGGITFANLVSKNQSSTNHYNRCPSNQYPGYWQMDVFNTPLNQIEFVPLNQYDGANALMLGTKFSSCYNGMILFKKGSSYGIIDPYYMNENGDLVIMWWTGNQNLPDMAKARNMLRINPWLLKVLKDSSKVEPYFNRTGTIADFRNVKRLNFSDYWPSWGELGGIQLFPNLQSMWYESREPLPRIRPLVELIEHMPKLVNLEVVGVQLEDLSYLQALEDLTMVTLYANQISNIDVLPFVPSLTYVNLQQNNVERIDALLRMRSLEKIILDENPLNERALNVYMPRLVSRGVEVWYQGQRQTE